MEEEAMTWSRRPLVEVEGSPSRRIVVNVTEAMLEALDRLAANRNETRSEAVRSLIRAADAERG
jgi:hypothetical protein